ncbi:glucose-6-phosphate isomerase [Candidatus Pelagibacter communis]|uniref:glucose-6-phosphate isomerase n=1 Tax=Candidatus Pelagibacter TaxID=198251 RepID=UPI003EE2A4D1
MLVDSLNLKFFNKKKIKVSIKYKINQYLKNLLQNKSQVIHSLSKEYQNTYTKKFVKKLKTYKTVNLIGMGGSILGAKAIYSFVRSKVNFRFIDEYHHKFSKKNLNKNLNLIISKSGNTLETITNTQSLSKNSKNIIITENKKNYLTKFASKLKADIVYHNDYIGGRYSVLSEVGMLPAELMGLNPNKFKRLNDLAKSKKFFKLVVDNVSMMLDLIEKKNMNSIILNYDPNSQDLFMWYQQLVAESLGKKGKGVLPIISLMPKDNHSVMQYYLDGPKKYFFTFFFNEEKKSQKINNSRILKTHNYMRNKNLNDISHSQFISTQKVFSKKKIPFRSFFIQDRNEKILGELFTFFILETILLGKMMKIDPFNQPAVELIKKETKKTLINI